MTAAVTSRRTIITIGEDGSVASNDIDRRTRWTATALAVVLGMGALALTAVATIAAAIIGLVVLVAAAASRAVMRVATLGGGR